MAETPLSPETVAAGQERARELRSYAARLEAVKGHVVRFTGQKAALRVKDGKISAPTLSSFCGWRLVLGVAAQGFNLLR